MCWRPSTTTLADCSRSATSQRSIALKIETSSWIDSRPVQDDGFYYLVRAANACGPAATQGWGSDSLGRARPACP